MIPPSRPIAIVCMVTPRSRARIGGFLGVKRVRNAGFVVAVGQEDEDLLLGRRDQQCLEPQRNRVTDVRAIVPRPCRSHCRDRFQQKRVIEDRGTCQIGIIGEDDQADQVVGTTLDEAR